MLGTNPCARMPQAHVGIRACGNEMDGLHGSRREATQGITNMPLPKDEHEDAYKLAKERYEAQDPTERDPFRKHLDDAYQHLEAQRRGAEGPSDPYAW